jgi:hypothetical protein
MTKEKSFTVAGIAKWEIILLDWIRKITILDTQMPISGRLPI